MLVLYSHPEWLSVVQGAVERLTETLGFPPAQCRSITRAVDEALTILTVIAWTNPSPCAFEERNAGTIGESNRG